jgi:transcriptional regulator with XRE-family HTH domain
MKSSPAKKGGHKPRAVSPIDRHIAERIKILRREKRMTRKGLAEQLGITPQQVFKYENETDRVSAGRLYEISKILGVPISWFYEGLVTGTEGT